MSAGRLVWLFFSSFLLFSCVNTPSLNLKRSIDYHDSNENGLSFRYPGNWMVVSNRDQDSDYPYYFFKLSLNIHEKLSPEAWNKTKCILKEQKVEAGLAKETSIAVFKARFNHQLPPKRLSIKGQPVETEVQDGSVFYRISNSYYSFRERPEDNSFDKWFWEYSVSELMARGILSVYDAVNESEASTDKLIAMEWISLGQLQEGSQNLFQLQCNGPGKLAKVMFGLADQLKDSLIVPEI